ncbi:glycoside hydrolase family 2 TIM barrel-domain containing protein [Echinicola shivajiensis]|uniref:glycoside hydrolase family 2 TIM barrel-domain containing protein n=1 Tax=Echinicola shivajiensis TaxID=1035916 RepID=UPI001BFC0299|nr:glycoside hydrolase family 2 TIM barrel-domain containing protein [Echinicola shivajiensis]
MRLLKNLTISLCILTVSFSALAQNIDLSGQWNVKLIDSNNSSEYFRIDSKIEGQIELPGSLAENGYGLKTTGSDFGVLTPEFKYIGEAEYSREILIPNSWKDKEIELLLERVLWESKVFIDGQEMGTADALGTPHYHQLGKLSPGKHTLTVRVNNDMIHNIGDKGHAYGEYTQSIWNGIVGKIELRAHDLTHIKQIKTFPNTSKDHLDLNILVNAERAGKAKFEISISQIDNKETVFQSKFSQKLTLGIQEVNIPLSLDGALKKWNEFDPTVYKLQVKLKSKKSEDLAETEFGFVNYSHDGTHVLVNGEPVFLRGNLDCVHFPLTGYSSAKVEDWERIFKIYKDYGLNHVRFHSWCPPEAAFKAANRIGIYMQAEASIWIDWWMSVDNTERGRPEMNTKGFPQGLGKDPERDQFVIQEMNRVVDEYGNHPSFSMFCIGNELGNSDFDIMKEWVADLKEKDPRHLYAVSTARTITEVDQYSATHYIKGVGRTRGLNGAHTDWDFEDTYSQMDIPIIAHEIGQWPVYPSWTEIDKYTGVLKARNFMEFKAMAEKNGIAHQAEDFKMASGALNQIMYKYETESFLRTKSCAGVQLLSMQDYQGQGEALIGWLDAHWVSKGITTPEEFREHFNETVPLLRMKKFIWNNGETFKAKAQLSHFGQFAIPKGNILVNISNASGESIYQENWPINNIKRGTLNDIGEIELSLKHIQTAQKLNIALGLAGTAFKNSWDIWVYPSKLPDYQEDKIIITDQLDSTAFAALDAGRKVLLLANQLGTEENSIDLSFYPLYWSLTFFPGQGKTNLGMLIQDQHPALKHFPTDYHSNWQWESISKGAKGFILNETPKSFQPMVQVVDDFHRNNKEGAIFEFAVGKGKLLVSGFDIRNQELPVAKQLRYSLIEYMNSVDFAPSTQVDKPFLSALFPKIPIAKEDQTDGQYNNIILRVNAGEKAKQKNTSLPWNSNSDQVIKIGENIGYKVKADGIWKDDRGSAWHGKEITLEIKVPDGILGSFYVLFDDWNKQGREGLLTFEGRKVRLGKHHEDGGKWIKFHVMREDSNDGKIILNAKVTNGGNLMIREIVLDQE